MLSTDRTPRRVRAFVDEVVVYSSSSPEQEARIAEHARQQSVRTTRPLVLVACLVGLVWWPFDFILYADRPDVLRVFSLWRAAVVVYCLVYWFTCDRWPVVRRHFVVWGTFWGSAMTFTI